MHLNLKKKGLPLKNGILTREEFVKELKVPIFVDGQEVYNVPSLDERKDYCNKQMDTLYPEIKRIINPHVYYVDLSEKLLKLKKDLIHLYTGK